MIRALTLLLLATLALTACTASRVLSPQAAGLTEIAPGLWTDDPAQADAIRSELARAQARIAPFWGGTVMPARMIVCRSNACDHEFGIEPLGQTAGTDIVMLGQAGANATVMGHELSHIALNRRLGGADPFGRRIPAWFNEGLATLLSPDGRYVLPDNARDADWVRQARSVRQWNALVDAHSNRDTYGAAARQVAEIEARIGRAGLRALVDAVAEGADFDAALAARMGTRP